MIVTMTISTIVFATIATTIRCIVPHLVNRQCPSSFGNLMGSIVP
jgi:hypothetical protein